MEADIKRLKKSLLLKITQTLTHPYHNTLKSLCIDSVSCLSIFKSPTLGNPIRSQLYNIYRNLEEKLINLFNPELDSILNEINNLSVQLLGSLFQMPQEYMTDLLRLSKAQNMNFTSEIISFTLGSCLIQLISYLVDFQTIWDLYLQSFFINFGLIRSENNFCKSFLFTLMCDKNTGFVVTEKVMSTCKILFGNLRNFKFFRKACKVYTCFQGRLSHLGPDHAYPLELRMKCTSLPEEYQKDPILNESCDFLIHPTGLESSNREDGLILIGKHQFCDVRLPETDEKVDDISFAVFFKDPNYLVVDCSKLAYLKSKLNGLKSFKITKNLLVDLVGTDILRVIDFKFFEDQEGDVFGEIFYEFIRGELSITAGSRVKRFVTRRRNINGDKITFVFGRGDFNQDVDVILSGGGRIGRKHLSFEFREEFWYLKDLESRNGSYLLFKDFEEFNLKKYSCPKHLYLAYQVNDRMEFSRSASLCISGYTFYIY